MEKTGANLSHQHTPFKTIWEKLVTSMETTSQVKVFFQDHPPNVSKTNLNPVIRPYSLKSCIKRVLSRPFRMDLKTTPFKTIVNRVNNLNPQYMVPANEATRHFRPQVNEEDTVTEQPSSSPLPPGS